MPLSFHGEHCLRCGNRLVGYGTRKNMNNTKKKQFCPKCNTFTTPGFDRGAHVPPWVYDRVLFSIARGYRNTDIQLEVKIANKNGPPDGTSVPAISAPTINRIAKSSLRLFDKFEPIALRGLSTKPINGIWCMDDRFHDLPLDQSLFPDKKLDPKKGNPHMYPTVVIHEETNYSFSTCVSRKRDKIVAMRALNLALDRAGVQPSNLKIDNAKGLWASASALLPAAKILCVNKKEDFAFNNAIEMWFGHFGLRHNKHQCQYKRPWTQERSMNIYRYYRNYIWPFKETGKTPAESLGLALPRNINNEISFIPLLEFTYRLTNFIESELARTKVKCL